MQRLISTASMGLAALLLLVVGILLSEQQPTTQQLDSDLSEVRQQLSDLKNEQTKYSGGLIKSLMEARTEILLNTEAMLVQKKSALIRRISLKFVIDGRELAPSNEAALKEILEEISQAEKKLSASLLNAERYSGGLIQVMALATAETDKVTLAQLRMKFYSMKHGFPLVFSGSGHSKGQKGSPGKVVKDREAL